MGKKRILRGKEKRQGGKARQRSTVVKRKKTSGGKKGECCKGEKPISSPGENREIKTPREFAEELTTPQFYNSTPKEGGGGGGGGGGGKRGKEFIQRESQSI